MIALLILNLACGCMAISTAPSCDRKDTDVLILGGGFAGVAAAKTLHDGGMTDFMILEGTDALGGRARRVDFGGTIVEKGANWIQGLDRENLQLHPIWQLKEKCGLNGTFYDFDNLVLYNQNGTKVSDTVSFNQSNKAWENACARIEELAMFKIKHDEPDISTREALMEVGWVPDTPVDNFLEWFAIDFCDGIPPKDISLKVNLDLPPLNGTSQFFVHDERGFSWLVECLAEQFLVPGDERLHFNSIVKRIQWGDDCVCVTAEEDNGYGYREIKTYCASYAIVSFSFGVLQSDNVEFDPPLPNSTMDLINAIGMVNYQKVFFRYNETFWDDVVNVGYAGEQRGYYSQFASMNLFLPGRPSILFASLTGELGILAEKGPVEDIAKNVTKIFRSIYGDSVPEPADIYVSNWLTDPLFLGTYTGLPVGVSQMERESIADPIGRLYITGEGVAEYTGYTHGAYLAGIKSAERILGEERGDTSAAVGLFPTAFLIVIGLHFAWYL